MEGTEKMTDIKQLSLIEAAETILKQNKAPMTFLDLFKVLSEAKGYTESEVADIISQFYADFIISAKFVYTGDDLWDLKSRQSIDLWDKDGAYYQEFPEYEEEADFEEDEEEEELEEDEEDELEEDEEEEDEIEPDFDDEEFEDEFEDDFEDEDEEVLADEDEFDDDKYNEYMDDYEDMYDE